MEPLFGYNNEEYAYMESFEKSVDTMTYRDAKKISSLFDKIHSDNGLFTPEEREVLNGQKLYKSLTNVQTALNSYLEKRDWKGFIADLFAFRLFDLYRLKDRLPNIIGACQLNISKNEC